MGKAKRPSLACDGPGGNREIPEHVKKDVSEIFNDQKLSTY